MKREFQKFDSSLNDKNKEITRISRGIHAFFNYWEMKPTQYEAKLHEYALNGFQTIGAFVPWAHFESDIHHTLRKFLKAVHDARLNVRLFVMPALGVNYPNCGVPKELIANHSNVAVDKSGAVIHNRLAPNIFALPTFSSSDVLKAYGNYLLKLSGLLHEISKETHDSNFLEVVISNGIFDSYRNPGFSEADHGDYSAAHVIAYRDFLEREYPTRELERFKTKAFDSVNRHRFFTHVSKLLGEKTELVFSKKQAAKQIRHVSVINPEAMPDVSNASLLCEVLGYKPNLDRFYGEIIKASERGQCLHFSSAGSFRRFTESEKGFLLLSSLIHCGEVHVAAEDLLKMPQSFLRRKMAIENSFNQYDGAPAFERETTVSYYSASQFSAEEKTAAYLKKASGAGVSFVTNLDRARTRTEKLVFIDPKAIVRTVEFAQAFNIAQGGKVVAIPAPLNPGAVNPMKNASTVLIDNYASDALEQIDKLRKARTPIKMNFGISYEVYEIGLGYLVVYDPSLFYANQANEIGAFVRALTGLAEIEVTCFVNRPEIDVVTFSGIEDQNEKLVFLLNPTENTLDCMLNFNREGATTERAKLVEPVRVTGSVSDFNSFIASSFEITVPARGVLALKLREAGVSEAVNAADGIRMENDSEEVFNGA